MTACDPRPYHHGNLREALLLAAEKMIESSGVQGLTLREISRALGVSHTSPRRHFADKRALMDALATRGFNRLGRMLKEAAGDRDEAFDHRFRNLARAHVDFASKHPVLFGWMFDAKHQPDAPLALLKASDEAFAYASAVFIDGQANGTVIAGDPVHLGLVGFAAMQGLVAISVNGTFKGVPLETLVGILIGHIILGLRPRV